MHLLTSAAGCKRSDRFFEGGLIWLQRPHHAIWQQQAAWTATAAVSARQRASTLAQTAASVLAAWQQVHLCRWLSAPPQGCQLAAAPASYQTLDHQVWGSGVHHVPCCRSGNTHAPQGQTCLQNQSAGCVQWEMNGVCCIICQT